MSLLRDMLDKARKERDTAIRERDNWRALCEEARKDYLSVQAQLADAVKQRDADRAELCNLQIAFNDWKVVHSTARIEEELAAALEANSMLLKAASDMEDKRDAALAENSALRALLLKIRNAIVPPHWIRNIIDEAMDWDGE